MTATSWCWVDWSKTTFRTRLKGYRFLSDIPLLGRLFRNDVVTVTKSNLLVFIRPTIIRDDEDLAGATAEKYRFIREAAN
jgi:general secretion pathway protein D